MKTATEFLTGYAAYHRDRRNIATHFVGIPMIVVGVTALLGALHPFVACAAVGAACLFYFATDVRLGIAMLAFNLGALWLGLQGGLTVGVMLFVAGWAFQFVGHYFEGKKPAFVDDLSGFLIGPLFVVTEVGFLLGLRKPLQADIEAKVGPTLIRQRRGAAAAP